MRKLVIALALLAAPVQAAEINFSSIRPDRPSAETKDPLVCIGYKNWQKKQQYATQTDRKFGEKPIADALALWRSGRTDEALALVQELGQVINSMEDATWLASRRFAIDLHEAGADELIVPYHKAILESHDFEAPLRTMWDLSRVRALGLFANWALHFDYMSASTALQKLTTQIEHSKLCPLYKFDAFETIVPPLTRWVDRQRGLALFRKIEKSIPTMQQSAPGRELASDSFYEQLVWMAVSSHEWDLSEELMKSLVTAIHKYAQKQNLGMDLSEERFLGIGSLSYSINSGRRAGLQFEKRRASGEFEDFWPPLIVRGDR